MVPTNRPVSSRLFAEEGTKDTSDGEEEPSAFDQVASKGLAGVLAIACAETIFWLSGCPWPLYITNTPLENG